MAIAWLAFAAAFETGVAQCQTQKPLVNADVVKMVKAGLGDDIIILAIKNKPSDFDTSPEELIRLKEQNVTQGVLNAMLAAIKPAAAQAAPAEPQPSPQAQQNQEPEPVWVGFYGTCRKGDLTVFKPTIYANQTELARLACNTFFYSVAQPGKYRFCATKGKCTNAVLYPGAMYYFRVLPTTLSYSISQVDSAGAEEEIRGGLGALDTKRILAPNLVTTSTNGPPSVALKPQ
jgi:hypothetical protein